LQNGCRPTDTRRSSYVATEHRTPPRVVPERLGHASIGITLDTYSHVMPGMQEEAPEKIDAGLRAALAG